MRLGYSRLSALLGVVLVNLVAPYPAESQRTDARYYQSRFPRQNSEEFAARIAAAPSSIDMGGGVMQPAYVPWHPQRRIAEGFEALFNGQAGRASFAFQEAETIADADWRARIQTQYLAMGPNGRIETLRSQVIARASIPVGPNTLALLAADPRLSETKAITDHYQCQRVTGGMQCGPSPDAANVVMAYHYMRYFVIPVATADAEAARGRYGTAIAQLLRVHDEPRYYGVSSVADLESYPAYTSPAAPGAALAGISAAELTSFPPRGQYGACTPVPGLGTNCVDLQIPQFQRMHPYERAFITGRIAAVYLLWGDAAYASRQIAEARAKFFQVLRIYERVWRAVFVLADGSERVFDPDAVYAVRLADLQLRRIALAQNYIGFADNYIPLQSYHSLRQAATHFVGQAKALERDALNFLVSAEREEEQEMLLRQGVAMAELTTKLEQARLTAAVFGLQIARENANLAQMRVNHLDEQISQFDEDHPIAVNYHNDAQGRFWAQAGGYITESSAYVGSVFGWSTSGGQQMRETAAQYQQLQHERAELALASEISRIEAARASQDVEISKLGVALSQADLAGKEEHLHFARTKTLTDQFWYQLSLDTRQKAHLYLRYGISLSWLAEQALEFESGELFDVIRFDYLATDEWLAADQLLLDLDAIEYRRLVGRREKSVPFTYVLSLRDRNIVDLERLKREGRLTFATTEREFDVAFPGTHNRRIKRVEVFIAALGGVNGVRGTLSKAPYSLVKIREAQIPAGFAARDWVQHTLTGFRSIAFRTDRETMILYGGASTQTTQQRPASDASEKSVFEDHGASGLWTIELPKASNQFNYSSIMDVVIRFEMTAFVDPELARAVQLEQRKRLALGSEPTNMLVYSLRQARPDAFYSFLYPAGDTAVSNHRRFLVLPVDSSATPPNQTGQTLRSVWITFVAKGEAPPLRPKLTSTGLNPSNLSSGFVRSAATYDPQGLRWYPQAQGEALTSVAAHIPSAQTYWTSSLSALGARLLDSWVIRLDAVDNPALRLPSGEFDQNKLEQLQDVIVQFGYAYRVPGMEGVPISFWYPTRRIGEVAWVQGSARHASQWTLQPTNAWQIESAGLAHSSSTESAAIAPTTSHLPPEFELSARVTMIAGAAVGLDVGSTSGPLYSLDVTPVTTSGSSHRAAIRQGSNTLASTLLDLGHGPSIDLRVISRAIDSGRTLEWFINDRRLLFRVPSAGETIPKQFQLRAKGSLQLTEVLVSDLTKRLDVPARRN